MIKIFGFLGFTKKILLILFFLILWISCSSEKLKKVENPNAKEYEKLVVDQEINELAKIKQNNVKERRTYSKFTDHIVKGGGNEILVEKINFNQKGYKKEQYRYASDGIHTQWIYDYDEFGNKKLLETYDGFRILINKTSYNFASNGILSDKWDEVKNEKLYYEYFYDDNYNLEKIHLFDNNKALYSTSFYKYANGLLDSIVYYKNNFVIQVNTFEYDSLNRIKKDILTVKDRVMNLIEYKYDQNGKIINLKEKMTEWRYTYNDSGDLIEEKNFNSDGDLQGRLTYEYNPQTNLLLNKVRFDGMNNPALNIRFEYEFY